MILHDVEQRSPEWDALRAGKPTASGFSNLVTSKGEPSKSLEPYALTLAAELYAGKPVDAWEGSWWMKRGAEIEGEALSFYAFMSDADTNSAGFVTDDAKEIGCSPDALVGGDGMVELKCLKAETHIKTILYYRKEGRCPTDYVQQTQGQMMICERGWCDLVFYHPDLPLLIVRQTPIKAIVDGLRAAIPGVLARRDEVCAILNEQAGKQEIAA